MKTQAVEPRKREGCGACAGSVPRLSPERAQEQIRGLDGWQLVDAGRKIGRDWKMRNFRSAMEFLNQVAELAERQGHHPDLHLEGYRNVSVVLSTHSIGGLSSADFVLAAAINELTPPLP